MPIATDHTAQSVNALSIGITPGRTGQPATQSDNSTIANYYAGIGYSLYFPPGHYEFSSAIAWTSASHLKIWGDQAALYQVSNSQKLISVTNSDSVEISGLHLHTQYFDSSTATTDGTDESAVFVESCNIVTIDRNTFEGFNSYACFVRGGSTITITNNKFRDGHWTDVAGQRETGDIRLGRSGSDVANQITITGNQCNTKSLLGISSQQPTRKIICCNNNVVSLDASGNEVTAYDALGRKAGIELQYYLDAATSGLTDSDDTNLEMIINDNVIQGARYAGISCQDFGTSVHSGIRGTISNNHIRYCGLETSGSATTNAQGAIVINEYRDLVINGNVISNIPDDGGLNGVSAIIVEQVLQRASTTGTPSSCVISNNIITNCAARGIYCEDAGDMLISGNTIQDIDGRQFIHVSVSAGKLRSGHVSVIGNKLAGEKNIVVDIVRIEGGSNEAEILVADNDWYFDAATWTGAWAGLLLYGTKMTISNNRLTGNGGSSVGIDWDTGISDRLAMTIINSNTVEGFGVGYQSNTAIDRGPFILSNCTAVNCTTDINNPNIYPGYWANTQAVVHSSAAPTHGDFDVGDVCWNIAPSSGNPMGWICTAAGTPGTWAAMSNHP